MLNELKNKSTLFQIGDRLTIISDDIEAIELFRQNNVLGYITFSFKSGNKVSTIPFELQNVINVRNQILKVLSSNYQKINIEIQNTKEI